MIPLVRIALAGAIFPTAVVGVAAIAVSGIGPDTVAAPGPAALDSRVTATETSPAALGVPSALADLIHRCERAVVQADEAALKDIRAQLSENIERAGGKATPVERYTYAYATWRLNHLMQDEKGNASKEGRDLLKQAQVVIEGLIEEKPDNAEAHALLGSLLGEQIGKSMWRGIRLGPKAGGAMETAYGLDKENPRVALQRGISFLFTPRLFGGGRDKAEKEFRRAQTLFAKETVGTEWPNWGRTETHVWLGQIMMNKKDYVQARDEYNRVLAMEPDYHWVSAVLLPALDEAEAKAR